MGGTGHTSAEHIRIAYQPALDGLRAVAVTLVLLFHHGFSWMTGGYVGVSVFFTLSGFLITSLLLAEHDANGRVSLAGFYSRRVKRLLPASLACLVVVAILGAAGRFQASANLRREIMAAALQVANWNDLLQGASYADLQGRRSPVAHFWSLAVEEQFYWLWPLVFAGMCMLVRHPRARAVALVLLALVGVIAAPVVAVVFGPDAAYLSTPARLGEILTGAALAGVLHQLRARPQWWQWVGWPALAAVLAAAVWWPSGSGPAYDGWLGVASLVSVALILGLQVPGPLVAALSLRPVVGLGRISYGVYVWHWPIYLLLDEARTGLTRWPLFGVRLMVTLSVSLVSYWLLEQPVRHSPIRPARLAPLATAAVAAVVVVAAVSVSTREPTYGAGAEELAAVTFAPITAPLPELAAATTSAVSTELPVPSRPVRILVLGDSTAITLAAGLVDFASDHPELAEVEMLASIGCGVIRDSTAAGDDGRFRAECDRTFETRLPEALAERAPDVVVILVTIMDASARTWNGAEGELGSDDPRYQQRMRADYATLRAQLLAFPSVHVAWLTAPPPSEWYVGYTAFPITPESFTPMNDEVRAMDDVEERVGVIEFAEWLTAREAGSDRSWRTDGLHLEPGAARVVVDELVWPALVRLAVS